MPTFEPLSILFWLVAWIGHAVIWVAVLNHLYGRRITKVFLKPWRLFTGVFILGFSLLLIGLDELGPYPRAVYTAICYAMFAVFMSITLYRNLRPKAKALLGEHTETQNLWPKFGEQLFGGGHWSWLAKLPGNQIFRIDFTELTLKVPKLPAAWDGLTIHMLSDFHFHGTPTQIWYEAILDRMAEWGTPDVVAIVGDVVDTDEHHAWIEPLLGKLKWKEAGFAILGNHEVHHHPEQVRSELAKLGFTILSNTWKTATIRGVEFVALGNETPWFFPAPDLSDAPKEPFRFCLSHCPDQFYWGEARGVNLMLCGHVHGGQVRFPVIGPIFVPSVYSRRFDCGVYERGEMVMVAGRGLSGKEPLRFRCNPQVLRITLKSA